MESERRQALLLIERALADLQYESMDSIMTRTVRKKNLMTKLVINLRKRMYWLNHCLTNHQKIALKKFFDEEPMTRSTVFNLVTTHCFSICNKCPNIFIAFVYCCYFINDVAHYIETDGGLPEYHDFAGMCAKEIFEHKLKEDFFIQGGFDELREYLFTENMIEMIDVMKLIYLDDECRYTTVVIENKSYQFGSPSILGHQSLVKGMPEVIEYAKKVFPNEMGNNTEERRVIMHAFVKLEEELKEFIRKNKPSSSRSSATGGKKKK